MKELYDKLNEINTSKLATGQKIESMVLQIFWYVKNKEFVNIAIIEDVSSLKEKYINESKISDERYAISNIQNWLSIDEKWLQKFRKTLDDRGVNVRIICKPNGIKHEPNGFSNREVKTIPNKYLLVSNIDILSNNRVIITNPMYEHVGLLIEDDYINSMLKLLFLELWNGNQYIVGVNSGDELSTSKRIEIMTTGTNYGIDYVINPVLYPKIFDTLQGGKKELVDFGCGLNTLGLQLLYSIPSKVEALKDIENIEEIRKNISKIIGFEANNKFVEEAIRYSKEFEAPELEIVWKELISNNPLPINSNSIDIGISRNFIVHLNYEDFEYHLSEARRILKHGGKYFLASLNPGYEHLKYFEITGKSLIDGERYNHYHGTKGELGTWVQFYKTKQNLENYISKYFEISSVDFCYPVNMIGKDKHPLYYNNECPMGIVYSLTNSNE